MAQQATLTIPKLAPKSRDIGFALGIVMISCRSRTCVPYLIGWDMP